MNPYIKAARIVAAKGIPSCIAINEATNNSGCGPYRSLFTPRENDTGLWLDKAISRGELPRRQKKAWRLTALCLAAAMYDAGDL